MSIDQAKGFHRYVRVSFCYSHPMGHVALGRGSIKDLRIISICPTVLLHKDVLIADRVATANDAEIGPAEDMIGKLDFQATYEWIDWSDLDGQARRNAAEKWEDYSGSDKSRLNSRAVIAECPIFLPLHDGKRYVTEFYVNFNFGTQASLSPKNRRASRSARNGSARIRSEEPTRGVLEI